LVERERIKAIHHVALCQVPAYAQAQVTAVRSRPEPPAVAERVEYWKQWTERVRRV
jgi:phage head maturation protease